MRISCLIVDYSISLEINGVGVCVGAFFAALTKNGDIWKMACLYQAPFLSEKEYGFELELP